MHTIIISGTTKGIGLALANYYLDKGYKVAGLARGESQISNENYIHVVCDIAIEEQVITAIKQVKNSCGSIDILINNAALANMNSLISTPLASFEQVYKVNAGGTFLLMREAAKQMIRQQNGRIINFTSISKPLNLETQSSYAASKAAVESLTKIAARELASFNITVNAIGPTPIDTDLIKGIPEEWMQNVLNMQAIKRKGTMDDIYNLCDFFISERSSFVTGQVVYLGGVS